MEHRSNGASLNQFFGTISQASRITLRTELVRNSVRLPLK